MSEATLRPLEAEADWHAFHAIRRAALFEERGRGEASDPAHPGDRDQANTPLLYRVDG
ncbi:hypothetical protein [Aureimonas sp. AU40]|uniref:hypothetical protein n=1 Tax=Aureimonas sp. AU40 TaxID=1637747 RepID=UPI000A6FCAD1|nr:hypothetical protein [Aureimonas sp. AU40]